MLFIGVVADAAFRADVLYWVVRPHYLLAMTDDYLDSVKREFGLTLPPAYVAFMRSYPQELETTKLELGWCQEAIAERHFLKSPEKVAELNRGVRVPGVSWLQDGSGWPARFWVIGDDQCGNYYAIDTGIDSGAVHFYDHEIGTFAL